MYNVYVKLYNLHVQGQQAIISMYSVYIKLYNLHIQGEESNIYQHINHAHCPGGENSDCDEVPPRTVPGFLRSLWGDRQVRGKKWRRRYRIGNCLIVQEVQQSLGEKWTLRKVSWDVIWASLCPPVLVSWCPGPSLCWYCMGRLWHALARPGLP